MSRVYLDWNATAPLRAEAREAMIAAMDLVGNPSSVHAEGRAAKAIVEKARAQVADLVGCESAEVVFTSGATEAIDLVCDGAKAVHCGGWEHDAVLRWHDRLGGRDRPFSDPLAPFQADSVCAIQAANSEVGFLGLPDMIDGKPVEGGAIMIGMARSLSDITQIVGKAPYSFLHDAASFAALSAHKIGGPKGVGACLVRRGVDLFRNTGAQEMGRRAGTENVIGIAGFGAAAAAAKRDLWGGVWDAVAEKRDFLEATIEDAAKDTIFVGKAAKRLPNTSCFATPGWKGETQVMQMDLAGFAISAGSACSSGKVKASRVLRAMGYDEVTASSAIRVSLGPDTTKDEIARFAEAWIAKYQRHRARAA